MPRRLRHRRERGLQRSCLPACDQGGRRRHLNPTIYPNPNPKPSPNPNSILTLLTLTPTKAGDVVIWSEATIHGATPWRGAQQRRLALYRFAPANMGYGRGYLEYPQEQLQQMTPMQRAVLEPPYADRLDRPLVTPKQALEDREGEMPTLTRNEEKRKLDEVLFGTKYF